LHEPARLRSIRVKISPQLDRHAKKDDQGALDILERARIGYPHVWEIISLESEILRESEGPMPLCILSRNLVHDNGWHYGAASLALGLPYVEAG
jgi:hypothetical protein